MTDLATGATDLPGADVELISGATGLRPFVRGAPVDGPILTALPGQAAEVLAQHGSIGIVAVHLRVLGWLATDRQVAAVVRPQGGEPVLVAADLAGSWSEVLNGVAGQLSDSPRPGLLLEQPDLRVTVTGDQLEIATDGSLWDLDRVAAYVDYLGLAAADILRRGDDAGAADAAGLSRPADRRLLTELGTGARRTIAVDGIVQLVFAIAERDPDRTAVVHGAEHVSYAELCELVLRWDRWLRDRGTGPADVVAVILPRGISWAASVLAVLRVGAVFLPLSPDDPAARLADLRTRADARTVIDIDAARDLVQDGAADPGRAADAGATPAFVPRGNEPAYVYYTSGSTGLPKGALCAHDGMMNHLWAKVDDLALHPGDVVLQSAQSTFDISLWQLLAPLMIGARCQIVDHADLLDVAALVQLIDDRSITVVQVVPSYLSVLLDHLAGRRDTGTGGLIPGVRVVSVTGEAISLELARRFFELLPGRLLINAYGATEASDDTTHEVMTQAPEPPSVPVGRPIANVTVRVLDPSDRPVPPGSPGEIVFSGVCVGLGYLGDPQRTAAAFDADPVTPGQRIYRSGDFGRWLPSGTLQFHGRRDEQVKVSGIRLELGEVENHLRRIAGIVDASVVTVRSGGASQLAGFFTATGPIGEQEVREALRLTLPAAAVPTSLVRLETLPLNANGKVDKPALRRSVEHSDPGQRQQQAGTGDHPAATPLDRLRTAWARALDLPADRIGIDADFFDLGGTSLKALRAVAAAGGLIGIADLFGHPTLRELAAVIERPTEAAAPDLLHRVAGPADPQLNLIVVPDAAQSARTAGAVRELAGRQVAVWGVQVPPDSRPRAGDAPAEFGALVDRLHRQLAGLPGRTVLVGHGTGAVLAVAAARGSIPVLSIDAPAADAGRLRRQLGVLQALGDAEVARRQRPDRVPELTPSEVEELGATLRRQQTAALGHLLDVIESGAGWDHRDLGPGSPADHVGTIRELLPSMGFRP